MRSEGKLGRWITWNEVITRGRLTSFDHGRLFRIAAPLVELDEALRLFQAVRDCVLSAIADPEER